MVARSWRVVGSGLLSGNPVHSDEGYMITPSPSSETTIRHPSEGMITLAHVIYALHAFSALTGLASSVLVLTAFLTGWPSIIAVILNYAKRSEVRSEERRVGKECRCGAARW